MFYSIEVFNSLPFPFLQQVSSLLLVFASVQLLSSQLTLNIQNIKDYSTLAAENTL